MNSEAVDLQGMSFAEAFASLKEDERQALLQAKDVDEICSLPGGGRFLDWKEANASDGLTFYMDELLAGCKGAVATGKAAGDILDMIAEMPDALARDAALLQLRERTGLGAALLRRELYKRVRVKYGK